MRRGLALTLAIHALVAGAGLLLLVLPIVGIPAAGHELLRGTLMVGLLAGFGLDRIEGRCAPKGRRREYERALRLLTHGPYAARRRLALIGGSLVPALLLVAGTPSTWAMAGLLALAGLYVEQDLLVRAGQSQPIS
jgi:hypothetical protein